MQSYILYMAFLEKKKTVISCAVHVLQVVTKQVYLDASTVFPTPERRRTKKPYILLAQTLNLAAIGRYQVIQYCSRNKKKC